MSATWSQIKEAALDGLLRVTNGAVMITVNGQQMVYTKPRELVELIKECDVQIAAATAADGRGAWEAAFSDENG